MVCPYSKCRTVDVMWIKAVRERKLLRSYFTVNTFSVKCHALDCVIEYVQTTLIVCRQQNRWTYVINMIKVNIWSLLELALLPDIKVWLQIIPSEKSHRNTDEQVSCTSFWSVFQMWQYFFKKYVIVLFNRSYKHQNAFPAVKHLLPRKWQQFYFLWSIGIFRMAGRPWNISSFSSLLLLEVIWNTFSPNACQNSILKYLNYSIPSYIYV